MPRRVGNRFSKCGPPWEQVQQVLILNRGGFQSLFNPEQRMGSMSPISQTPGDPRGPAGGEPTIMAFRRPTDRPAAGGSKGPSLSVADALPVLLKLPDLAGEPDPEPVVRPSGLNHPWIGMALWCASGVLAVLAVVLLLIGKPAPEISSDEAPAWQPPAAESGTSNYSPQFRASNDTGFQYGAPASGGAAEPLAEGAGGQPVDDGTMNQPEQSAWPNQGPVAQAGDPLTGSYGAGAPPGVNDPSLAAPGGAGPDAGYPDAGYPGAPYGNGPDGTGFPAGPGSGPMQPSDNPGGPAGLSDPWPQEPPTPDQTRKLERHSYRNAALPNSAARAGDAKLGPIQYLGTRPTDDSTR
jgi:hypothetical protein